MTETGASIACGNCGHAFADYWAAHEVDSEGNRTLGCPDCGSVIRHYSISVTETLTLHEKIAVKAKHAGDKKPYQMSVSGSSYFKQDEEWHEVQRTIDRDNNRYDEVIRNAAGDIVREVHEPLSEHTGRGSAKPRDVA